MVLTNDNNSFKTNLLLVDVMNKSFFKALKFLDPLVECFLPRPSSTHKLLELLVRLAIGGADAFGVSLVAIVTNGL